MRCDKNRIEKWIWLKRLVIESYRSKCIILFIIWKVNDRSVVRSVGRLLVLSAEWPFPVRSVIDWLTAKYSSWLQYTKVVRLNLEKRWKKIPLLFELISFLWNVMPVLVLHCAFSIFGLVRFGSNVLCVLVWSRVALLSILLKCCR